MQKLENSNNKKDVNSAAPCIFDYDPQKSDAFLGAYNCQRVVESPPKIVKMSYPPKLVDSKVYIVLEVNS